MTITVKLILGIVLAVISATIVSVIASGAPFDPLLLAVFIVTTLAAVLLGNMGASGNDSSNTSPQQEKRRPRAEQDSDDDREFGEVKWFNVSKGFGFIIRENGEEIFVHFRSIQGQGRRGLRDGQRVSFIVVENEKGPQAEDVAPEG